MTHQSMDHPRYMATALESVYIALEVYSLAAGTRLRRAWCREAGVRRGSGSISAAHSPMSLSKRAGSVYSAKILTTPQAPERAVLEAVSVDAREAVLTPGDLSDHHSRHDPGDQCDHRAQGAKTALLTTEGFRDTIAIRHENRFEQYDVNIDLPPPLVPRRLRFPVRERIDARGRVLIPLDEAALMQLADRLAAEGVEVYCDWLPPQLYEPGARAPRRRDPRRAPAQNRDHLVERGVAGDARIRALLDRLRQRLCPAADRPISRQSRNLAASRGFHVPALPDAGLVAG